MAALVVRAVVLAAGRRGHREAVIHGRNWIHHGQAAGARGRDAFRRVHAWTPPARCWPPPPPCGTP